MNSKDNSYNVYNKFDPNFVNYGGLYKSPREMKQNSKLLINHYADALVKGESPVYKDSPNLVGNRYFINTNSQCLDKNDRSKTHPKSILVDNVNSSAMETTKDGNTGLIYSLLASLKTINGEEMFNDISNNVPTEYINNSTDYLKDLSNAPMPLCSKITVFANDNKEEGVSGWITSSERQNIDPKAIKEGFIQVALETDSSGNKLHPGAWAEEAKKTSEDMQDQAEAVSEEAKSSSDSTLSAANSAKEEGKKTAKSIKSSSSSNTKSQISSQSKIANDAFNKGKKKGAGMMLKDTAQEYLNKHSKENILFFIKNAINSHYNCKGDLQKYTEKKVVTITSGQQKLYDKYKMWLKMKIAKNIIRERMIADGLDPNVVLNNDKSTENINNKEELNQHLYDKYKKWFEMGIAKNIIREKMIRDKLDPNVVLDPSYDANQEKKKEDTSQSVRIPAKCIYSIFEKNPIDDFNSITAKRSDLCYGGNNGKISVKNVFNAISNSINKNKTNSKVLDVPGLPSPKMCIWSYETTGFLGGLGIGRKSKVRKDVASDDYNKVLELLNRYRLDFAIEIIRYTDVDMYGNCEAVGDEGFTTINQNLTPYKSYPVVNYGAYLFIIFMIFLIFFVVYKCMFRAFNFKSVLKNLKIGKK